VIDHDGIILRSGRRLDWTAVRRIGVVKMERYNTVRTVRLDIYNLRRVTRLWLACFRDREQVARALRDSFDRSRAVAAPSIVPAATRAAPKSAVSGWAELAPGLKPRPRPAGPVAR
jgi:hypothetical protein